MLTAKSADRSINHVGCHVLLTSKEKYRYHLIMNNEPPTGFYIFLVFKILPYGTVFSKLLVAVWRIRIRGIYKISLDPDPYKKMAGSGSVSKFTPDTERIFSHPESGSGSTLVSGMIDTTVACRICLEMFKSKATKPFSLQIFCMLTLALNNIS